MRRALYLKGSLAAAGPSNQSGKYAFKKPVSPPSYDVSDENCNKLISIANEVKVLFENLRMPCMIRSENRFYALLIQKPYNPGS